MTSIITVRYPCDKCDYRDTTKGHLKEHVESIHEDVRYPCGQCDCRVTTKGNLKEHVRSIQEGVSYPCDQYYYSTLSLWQVWLQRYNKGPPKGTCWVNSWRCPLSLWLEVWRIIWELILEKNHFPVNNVQNAFQKLEVWRLTWELILERNYFLERGVLNPFHNLEVWRVTWELNWRETISCKQCSTSFSRAEHLKKHMKTHSGEKTFACQ